jgi:tetratricopeptide (TPR) repeat protein
MSQAPLDKHRISFGATRELLLPAMVCGGFVLYYFGEQPPWVVLCAAAPVLLLYALAPLWAARSVAAFDRDSVRMLASGGPARLKRRYQRALGMRLFAPPGQVAERKAMVLLQCGSARAAQAAFAEALEELGKAAPDRVVLGAAHASFAAYDYASAITLYRRVLAGVGALPGVERKLAHALVQHGEDLSGALALLARTEHEVAGGAPRQELFLLCALAHAKLGEPDQAQAALTRAEREHAEPSEAARDLKTRVLEQLQNGRSVAAR